jgi:hypothetical protein
VTPSAMVQEYLESIKLMQAKAEAAHEKKIKDEL